MENYKGNSLNNVKIDLELKLGQYKEEEEKERDNNYEFSIMDDKSSYNMGGEGNGGMGSSSMYFGSSKSLVVYPQPNIATPNRKRGNVDNGKVCRSCGSNNTPLWRKGPQGPQTLCNACGLRHLRTIKRGGE